MLQVPITPQTGLQLLENARDMHKRTWKFDEYTKVTENHYIDDKYVENKDEIGTEDVGGEFWGS